MWNKAENMIKAADELGLSYEEAIGEAAFYGLNWMFKLKQLWVKKKHYLQHN